MVFRHWRGWIRWAIGDMPRHLPRYIDWRRDRFWFRNHQAITLTVFQGSGHWMLTLGPTLVKSWRF